MFWEIGDENTNYFISGVFKSENKCDKKLYYNKKVNAVLRRRTNTRQATFRPAESEKIYLSSAGQLSM